MYRCHKISGLITCNNSDFFFYTAINDDFFFTVVVFLKNIVLLPCQKSKELMTGINTYNIWWWHGTIKSYVKRRCV